MERVERLVRTWMASGRDEEVRETVAEISGGDAVMLDVVKALGEYLTAEDDQPRTKGVEFLSLVLSQCPQDKMNRNAVRVLCSFMCNKLEDTETIIPALKGIKALVLQPAFTSSDAVDVVKALFGNVKMRALVQSQRFLVFSIVDLLVAQQRTALKSMGEEFLRGYVSLAEGEKDPRNLLLAFSIARVLLIEFDVTHHIEQLFNITFCYFPITFRPPPDDPYGITSEDLKKALRECLSATPAFGSLAIPLFLEKLIAGSPTTKRDTLQTLDICLPTYGPGVTREHAQKLWNSLKLEIFQPTDIETESTALKTTQVLIQTIYSIRDGADTDLEIKGLAKDACDECIRILKEPEKSQAKPAIKVLCAFMSTTPLIARFTLAQAAPHLVKIFLNPDEIQNRGAVLQLLSDLVHAARTASTVEDPDTTDSEEVNEVPLAPYKDEILGVFSVGLKVPSGCQYALKGLLGMVTTPGLMSDEELGFIVHNVNEILSSSESYDEDLRDAILELFTSISSQSPKHVVQTTLPLLFISLPDNAPPREAESERLDYWRTLSFLQRLCIQPDLFEMLVVRLSTKLDLVCESKAEDQEPTAAYAHSLLRTLADAFSKKLSLGHVDIVKYLDRLVPRLFNLHIHAAFATADQTSVASHPRTLAVSAEIITYIVQATSAQRQEALLSALFAAYLGGDFTKIAHGQQKIPEDAGFHPFSGEASSNQRNLVVLFSATIVALHKEVVLPVPDRGAFLDQLLQWAVIQSESNTQLDAVVHTLASVLNKNADAFPDFVNDKLERFRLSYTASIEQPLQLRRKTITAWAWMTKALMTRGDPAVQKFVDHLFSLFDDPAVSWDAARAIGTVVGSDKILTKKNHAIVKFLFAQKFANTTLPRLLEGAKTSNEPTRQNAHLVALAFLIRSIPKTVYAHQLPALMPLLLRSLDLPDHEIRANVIDILQAVADPSSKDNNVVTEHASSVVNTILRNSLIETMPSARVRSAALRYLATIPSLVRYDVLHPQKATVLRELAKALDDPKKSVRKEAVEARTSWYKFTG